MNVDLIYPGLVNLGFNSIGKGGMNTNWINLGLGYLGAVLRREGHRVRILDLRAMEGWKEVYQKIETGKPEVVGVHVNTPNLDQALECCRIAKSLNRVVVVGGPHPTIDPESMLNSGVVDYVVTGEGEKTFSGLIHELQEGRASGTRLHRGEIISDLDSLPFPAWDLYPIDRVLNRQGNYPFLENGIPIIASRGCHANCSFCQPLVRTMFGNRVRYRSPQNVLAEIRTLVDRFQLKYFSFQDDTFTANKAWVLEMCETIREAGLDLQWSAQSRVDTFDEEIAFALKNAGCVCLFFGFESGSQRILNVYRKGITPAKSRRAARICRKAGLIIFADFIFGGPTETPEEMELTVDLIDEIKPELPSPTFFTPIPGCDLHDLCKKEGILLDPGSENYDRSPQGKKIQGIDYEVARKCVLKTVASSPRWFEKRHLARLAVKRWKSLLLHGEILSFLKELADKSLQEGGTLQNLLRQAYRRLAGR